MSKLLSRDELPEKLGDLRDLLEDAIRTDSQKLQAEHDQGNE